MLGKISNLVEMDAVTYGLPDDVASDFRKGVLHQVTGNEKGARLMSAAKGAYYGATGRWPTALKNISQAFKTYSPEEQALIDAAKSPSPSPSGKYSNQYSDLKNRVADDEYEAALGKLQEIGEKPLELPEYRPNVTDTAGNTRPMTDDEWSNHIYQVKRADETSATSDVRKAQEMRAANELAARNEQARALNEAAKGRGASELGQKTVGAGNPEILPYEDDFIGFKHGGKVEPTEAQKKAGNYKKEHVSFHGLNISIETPKGGIRSGKNADGNEWSVKMPYAYGYFKRSEGGDGEHVDCFLGPNKHSLRVYVIDQKHLHNGKWDEHKVMLGFPDRESAMKAYKESFSDGNGHKRIMKITKMLMPSFKEWLKNGNTKKPMKEAA
jgi:hypothetical protein